MLAFNAARSIAGVIEATVDGWHSLAYVPDEFVTPCVYVITGRSVRRGPQRWHRELTVAVVDRRDDVQGSTERIDHDLPAIVDAVATFAEVTTIEPPVVITRGGVPYLATLIPITIETTNGVLALEPEAPL